MKSIWEDKVWLAIGDSITYGDSTNLRYTDIIKDQLGVAVCDNVGLNGSGFATYHSTPLHERIDGFRDQADLITIFYGTNDWNNQSTKPLGTMNDTAADDTFTGRVKMCFDMLVEKYPLATIAVITPLPRANDQQTNGRGEYLVEYVDRLIHIANAYSFPVYDGYRNTNFNRYNATFLATCMPDGLHPNAEGHKLVARKVLSFINSL